MKEYKKPSPILMIIALVAVVIQMYPLVYLFNFSLLKNSDFFVSGLLKIPAPPQWINYVNAWVNGNVPMFMLNSVIVCTITIIVTLFLVITLSYAFVKMQWKGRGLLFIIMLMGMMIPAHTTLIPNYIVFQNLGIRDTYFSMLIPYIAFNVPFGVFMMSGFMKGIPNSLIEAAEIDGCGTFKVIFELVAPLTKPAMASIGITTFLSCWNEFVMAATFLSSETYKTLPLSIVKFTTEHGQDLASQFAVMSISALPCVIIFCLFSEKITAGIMAGAVKE